MATRSEERIEFLKDIIVCFAEDYGTNSWRQISAYNPDAGTCSFLDVEADNENEYHVTIETVAKGVAAIVNGNVTINPQMLKAIKTGDLENDAGVIDAYDADMIVQAAVFGELVYG